MKLDLKLKGGLVVDGSGQDKFAADIGIKDGIIVTIGNLSKDAAVEEYDINGFVVAPGFIDIHSHSDFSLLANPLASGKVYQGVTTEVVGNCGSSAAPVTEESKGSVIRNLQEYKLNLNWNDFTGYFKEINRKGCALNIASLVGHGLLRKSVMGDKTGEPTNTELKKMQKLLAQAMEGGAWGLSTGLIYPPSSYAKTDELIKLSKVVAEYNGIYASHIRNEGDKLITAVEETIEIGKQAEVVVQISHHKTTGRKNWGKVKRTLELIANANQKGLNINCDVYPYLATSTGLAALLPPEVNKGGRRKVLKMLQEEETIIKIKKYWQRERREKESWDKILIAEVSQSDNQQLIGKSIQQIAEEESSPPEDIAINLLIAEELSVSMVKFSMLEADLEEVITSDFSMIGSDALTRVKDGILDKGKPHPRAYGTFPKVIKEFVVDKELLTLEAAIKKMTSMPAQKLGLSDRGKIAPNLIADLVVFELNQIKDRSTYSNPHQYAQGIKHLLVNGQFVIKDYQQNNNLPGKVLCPV
ncbi:MAG: N-acyl-D-amino-acid deacylase [Candidatus Frackibacter sp. T328-2]|nr:MAG: N-acyl-D-amino-acid deacylase [Candidatus Frackibacter sp. T328-2]